MADSLLSAAPLQYAAYYNDKPSYRYGYNVETPSYNYHSYVRSNEPGAKLVAAAPVIAAPVIAAKAAIAVAPAPTFVAAQTYAPAFAPARAFVAAPAPAFVAAPTPAFVAAPAFASKTYVAAPAFAAASAPAFAPAPVFRSPLIAPNPYFAGQQFAYPYYRPAYRFYKDEEVIVVNPALKKAEYKEAEEKPEYKPETRYVQVAQQAFAAAPQPAFVAAPQQAYYSTPQAAFVAQQPFPALKGE